MTALSLTDIGGFGLFFVSLPFVRTILFLQLLTSVFLTGPIWGPSSPLEIADVSVDLGTKDGVC